MPSTRSSRKRQSRLHFEPLPASSPARISQPAAVRERAAAVTLGPHGKVSNSNILYDEPISPPPDPASQDSLSSYENRGSKGISRPSFMSSGVTSKAQRKFNTVSLDDSDDAEEVPETPAKQLKNHMSSSPPDVRDGSDSDVIVITPRRRLVRQNPRVEDSEDEPIVTPSKRRRIQRRSSTQNGNDTEEALDSDEWPVRSSGRILNRRLKPAMGKDTSDDEEEDKTRSIRSSRKAAIEEEEEDLAEDLEFLSPANEDEPRTLRASFSTPKKNARTKALEALKRRRSSQGRGGDEPQERGSPSDNVEDEDEEELPFLPTEVADEYDEEFIVEDDEDGQRTALPIEFSHLRSEKPATLFKYVIEWMVQKKLNPGFRSSDDIYHVAFDRLNSFARQMGGSKFQSSAWTSTFLKSLNSRPEMDESRIDGSLRDRCDACNRSGHPATFEIHFLGRTYNEDTLEHDSEDESEGEDEGDTFYLGKFCRANAKMAHTFRHWRYHLNTWVVDYLRQENYLDSAKIVERDSWSTKRRQKYANEVVDHMESDGQIKGLYRDFKNSVRDAQDVGSADFFDSSP